MFDPWICKFPKFPCNHETFMGLRGQGRTYIGMYGGYSIRVISCDLFFKKYAWTISTHLLNTPGSWDLSVLWNIQCAGHLDVIFVSRPGLSRKTGSTICPRWFGVRIGLHIYIYTQSMSCVYKYQVSCLCQININDHNHPFHNMSLPSQSCV